MKSHPVLSSSVSLRLTHAPSRFSRRVFIGGVLGICAALLLTGSESRAHSAERARPNVVFILMDDLGWADLGCMGSRYYRTPNIDRLASQGLRFTQAYAACPVCSPTRAALLTGKYPARLHLTDFIPGDLDRRKNKMLRPDFHQELPLEEITLAEMLRDAGYATAAIGKWHLGGAGFEPQKQGFAVALGGIERGSVNNYFAPFYRDGTRLPGLGEVPDGEFITERLTREAELFLEQNSTRPFFLYLPHYAVHTPLQAREALIAKYRDAAPHGQQRNPVFAAMVETMDDSVGRILRKLDELKLTENTIVIFSSDNGGLATSGFPTDLAATNNAPLRDGKGYLYEGGIRVPLIVRWPAVIKPDTTCDVPISSVDLVPTICAACEINRKLSGDGVNLLPLLAGKSTLPERDLFWHYPHHSPQGGKPGGAVRSGDYKLIEFYDSGRRELYHLARDPSENQNLIESEPEIASRLAARLAAWRSEVDAQMPTPNPDFVPDEQADDGTVTLPAETADVHGITLRYEPVPHKDTLGFWVRQDDWASWDFLISKPGRFTVEILQGCGTGSGGSQVEFALDDNSEAKVVTTVEETGGFQNFIAREIGELSIDSPGKHTLRVRAISKPGAAVMDLRRVRLIPQPSAEK